MFKNIPYITEEILKETTNEMRKMVTTGILMEWLNKEMMRLSVENKVLADYLKFHAEKFAMTATLAPNVESIITSKLIEELMLLFIIDKALEKDKNHKKELSHLDDSLEDVWGDVIDSIFKNNNQNGKTND